jgi:WD40 repeat protein
MCPASIRVQTLAFSPDGRILASGSYDHTIRLWDVQEDRSRGVLQGHSAVVNDLAFTSDNYNLRALGAFEETSVGE